MVQLGPVDFFKERMSQDSMLTSLSQAAQAHAGVLGHELREKERVNYSFTYNRCVTRQQASALADKPMGGVLADVA
jgi:hypothetical protein